MNRGLVKPDAVIYSMYVQVHVYEKSSAEHNLCIILRIPSSSDHWNRPILSASKVLQ